LAAYFRERTPVVSQTRSSSHRGVHTRVIPLVAPTPARDLWVVERHRPTTPRDSFERARAHARAKDAPKPWIWTRASSSSRARRVRAIERSGFGQRARDWRARVV